MIYKWCAEKKADEDIEHVFEAGQRRCSDDDDDDDDYDDDNGDNDDVAAIFFKSSKYGRGRSHRFVQGLSERFSTNFDKRKQ